jgi:hypothetical protein
MLRGCLRLRPLIRNGGGEGRNPSTDYLKFV